MSSVNSVLQPLAVSQPRLTLGQTVLAIGVVNGLDQSIYDVPYIIGSLRSAATYFGSGSRFTRGLAELMRQGATDIIAVAISDESDLVNLLDYLVDQPFDIVVPIGLNASVPSRVSLFANFAHTREQLGRPVVVVMSADGTQPNPGLSCPLIPAQPVAINTARYFVFAVDQLIFNPNLPAQYIADAAPSVAGLISRFPAQISVTNQTLRKVKLASELDATTRQSLSKNGFFCLRNSVRKGVTPQAAVTAASSGSYLNSLTILRCTQYVTAYLQQQTQGWVGEPAPSQVQKLVSDILTSLQDQGVILAYSANTQVAQVQGTITITLSILPPYETQMVTVYTRVNLQSQ
jgi:hypothetical protein